MPYIGPAPAKELVLDADGDTIITSDADDQINVKVGGAEDFRISANTLSVLSGTTLNIDSGATIANSGTATGFAGVDTSGTPANNQLAIFTDADTVEGDSNLTYDGTDLILAGGNINVDSGKGIDFSATADSNAGMTSELFGDYEEGVYNPTLVGSTSGSFSLLGTDDTLAYTKIGRMVYIQGYLFPNVDNSCLGAMRISLPTTPATLPDLSDYSVTWCYVQNHGGSFTNPSLIILPALAYAQMQDVSDAGVKANMDGDDVDDSWQMILSFNYISS